MKPIMRVIAVLVTFGFAILAVPYVLLTLQAMVAGRTVGGNMVLILAIYIAVGIVLAFAWRNLLRAPNRK